MEKVLVAFGFAAVGFIVGLLISPIGSQHTEITIKTNSPYIDYNFKSNRLKDGDTYLIIKDGDTISSGVVINRRWE